MNNLREQYVAMNEHQRREVCLALWRSQPWYVRWWQFISLHAQWYFWAAVFSLASWSRSLRERTLPRRS